MRYFCPSHIAVCLALVCLVPHGTFASVSAPTQPVSLQILSLPLAFEPNAGQHNVSASYVCRGQGYSLGVSAAEATLVLKRSMPHSPGAQVRASRRVRGSEDAAAAALRIELLGANRSARVGPGALLPGTSNYMIGSDPSKWHTNLPNHESVTFRGVYPGTDIVYYGNGQQLEYDFRLQPGTNPDRIRMSVSGADEVKLDEQGNVNLICSGSNVRMKAPVAYQEIGGRRVGVECRYRVADGVVAFALAGYDDALPLVIDPVLSYSSFLGGSGADEANGVAVDESGLVYITGRTEGGFPVSTPAYDTSHNGVGDVFVIKLDTSQSGTASRVYATYIGGSAGDVGRGIAADSSGNAYVCGYTNSSNFPKSYQPVRGSGADAFALKLNATGTKLIYAAQIGGDEDDHATAIAIDANRRAYVTGRTESSNFPARNEEQGSYGGSGDAFLFKLGPFGRSLICSTYLGGSALDEGLGIAVDADGRAVVTGVTESALFPVTDDAFQPYFSGGDSDAFVTKFNLDGDNHVFSTFLGGNDESPGGNAEDAGVGIAVDASQNIYIAGYTSSTDFPTDNAIDDSFNGGEFDAFAVKMMHDGTDLIYSTYFGGDENDYGYGIAIDKQQNIYFCGETNSPDLYLVNELDNTAEGSYDAFAVKLDSVGETVVFSTYLGARGADAAYGIAVGPGNKTFLAGTTSATGFPTTPNALQPTAPGGGTDGFVACLAPTVSIVRDDMFDTGNVQPGGSSTGWSTIGQADTSLVQMDYDVAQGSYRVHVFAEPNRYRLGGWTNNKMEWIPYSSIGTDKYVRGKFYMYATGQTQSNSIPNFRLRLAHRYAATGYLEVYHHGDPKVESLSNELRPSTDPAVPSLYRVDYDPVDIPFLGTSTTGEGVMAGYDVFVLLPQDDGYIAMTECAVGTYPASAVPNTVVPVKVYEPGGSDAGSLKVNDWATDLQMFNWMVPAGPEGTYAIVDNATPPPTYAEGTFGVTLDTSAVPSDRIGAIMREFYPGSFQAQRARVSRGEQYKIRYHVTSTRPADQNAQLVLRSRSIRYSWVNRFEIGGAWPSSNVNNYTVAQQTLPGIGCMNPEKEGAENGGWYTLLVHTPMSIDIRPDMTGKLNSRMPNICREPGFGQNAASYRDLRVAVDTYDTLSTGGGSAGEASNFTIDRIEVRVYPLVDD